MPGPKGSKKLIAIPESLLNDLAIIAKRSGLTISELVTLILSFATRTLHGKDNISSIFTEAILLTDMHRLGGIVVPQRGLAQLVNSADPIMRDQFIKEVESLAASIAVSAKLRSMDNITAKDLIYLFAPSASIDEINEGNTGKIVITLAEQPGKGMLELLKAVSTRVLEAWGLKVEAVENYGSIVVLQYKRSS
ncbi:MAG TPA: hypothetical protein EYH50_00425 [Pyrodictium delaneyi]|uniref:Uncharacterized protein n=1 Tax=Pyrodictium delaneyi TaxID=1273541 RepID=A0A832ZSG6_9CREN|nr:hypothetical protein [Pyrodictium delaneyi]